MAQINFRVDNSIKLIMDILARNEGKSIAQIAKEYILKNIEPVRVDLAFNLLKEGKIGRKKAWKISGLEYSLFVKEWRDRGAEWYRSGARSRRDRLNSRNFRRGQVDAAPHPRHTRPAHIRFRRVSRRGRLLQAQR